MTISWNITMLRSEVRRRRINFKTVKLLGPMNIHKISGRFGFKLFILLAGIVLIYLLFREKPDEEKTLPVQQNDPTTEPPRPKNSTAKKKTKWPRINKKDLLLIMRDHNTITENDIFKYLVARNKSDVAENLCPSTMAKEDPSKSYDEVNDTDWSQLSTSLAKSTGIAAGGEWRPSGCVSQFLVAIIVPVQNRESNLRQFLRYIHPFVQRQNIHYKIYVIELDSHLTWNKGILFNAGYVEAMKEKSFQCLILHDVDSLPKHPNHIYACNPGPRFMACSRYPPWQKERFALPGVANALLSEHYKLVNGFSNKFFNWGAEDNDFYGRVLASGLPIYRYEPKLSHFYSLSHAGTKSGNLRERDWLLFDGKNHYHQGLNTAKYKVIRRVVEPLYTRIVISYRKKELQ